MLTIRCVMLAACAAAVASSVVADDDVVQVEREKKFAEALSGAVLVGTFSVDGVKTDKLPLAERYELKSGREAREYDAHRSPVPSRSFTLTPHI